MEVGIDVGGTHTRVLVADGATTLREARALTASWRHGTLFSDPGNAARLLALVPAGALGRADVAIAVGAHGCDSRAQCETLAAWLRRDHPGPVLVVNDSELLGPATGVRDAISVVCGTGSIVVGRGADGDLLKVGGFGWLLGDPGAAPSLVRESVVAILRAHDEGSAPGALARSLMAHYGSPDPIALGYDFTDDAGMTRWGALAPLVFTAADAGDPLAAGVIEAHGHQLAADVCALRAQGVGATHVVAGGGVITAQRRLEHALGTALRRADPALDFRVLHTPPVTGALALARSLLMPDEGPQSVPIKESVYEGGVRL